MSLDNDSDHSTITTQEEASLEQPSVDQDVNSGPADKLVTGRDDHDHGARDHDHDRDDQDTVHHDVVSDVIMWRRRKVSALVLLLGTVVWVMLQFYGFKFLHIASWTAMGFVTVLFLYGSFLRLLGREVPNMAGWEVTEQSAKDMADSTKQLMEKGIRWMFRVSCEKEWYNFAGVVSALLVLAYLGHHFDMLTLLYSGSVVGMTVPLIYVKKENEIKAYKEKARVHGTRLYDKIDDRVLSKLKRKERKDKKVE